MIFAINGLLIILHTVELLIIHTTINSFLGKKCR